MKHIGLLMICDENDVLERTLASNARYCDHVYVLDGTTPNSESEAICRAHPKVAAYTTDAELPRPPYSELPRDGWRQHLYEQAVGDHGHDNWFLLLHGDEVWTGLPDDMPDGGHDGYTFPLPLHFPRAGEEWDHTRHPLDQLGWHLAPGYRELRMFRGSPDVRYDRDQHFNVQPAGLRSVGHSDQPIRHYLYRSPDAQRQRAARHQATKFDPANYQHIVDQDAVYWTDAMIDRYRSQDFFRELAHA